MSRQLPVRKELPAEQGMTPTRLALTMAERGWLPDSAIRAGIRHLLRQRLQEINANDNERNADLCAQFIECMNRSPIAPMPELANAQHYEVPAQYFALCLGPQRKYSSCYWDADCTTLADAEEKALALTAEHAQLQDGQDVLELGCGWGSLSLWMAAHYPNSRIVAVSNSNSQREHIALTATQRGLHNLRVITCDMNHFDPVLSGIAHRFDRIVSVEMFEHMRNYRELYSRVADWLNPGGKFMKHIFVHRQVPYAFEVSGDDDWMSQYFFSGGMMPSDDLPLHFQQALQLEQRWRWDGRHYEKTLNAWLAKMDAEEKQVTIILAHTYGVDKLSMWRNRWRIFYMACAELFGFNHGQEWFVSHYLFVKRS
jgi:cyclopropane-fatty-acyl-phospholipid synthase